LDTTNRKGAVFMKMKNEEERIKAIHEVESGECIASVARRYKISYDTLDQNVKQYRENGLNGLHTHAYHWTAEQKYQVLEYMRENQITRKETAIRFGIGGSKVICDWERRYLEKGISGLESNNKGRKPRVQKPKPPKTRLEELEEENLNLRIENDYLKKLNALVAEWEKRERESK
jgi:transposase